MPVLYRLLCVLVHSSQTRRDCGSCLMCAFRRAPKCANAAMTMLAANRGPASVRADLFAGDASEIRGDHHGHQLADAGFRLPSEHSGRFGRISKQHIDLGGAKEFRIDDDAVSYTHLT